MRKNIGNRYLPAARRVSVVAGYLVTGVPMGSPSMTVSCSRSVNSGISSLTSSSTMKMVASLASCWAPLFYNEHSGEYLQLAAADVRYPAHLHSDGEVVLLDALEVQGLVDLHVGVGPAVLLALLQVEGVVLVGLVRGAADQLVEDGGVVLDPGAEQAQG